MQQFKAAFYIIITSIQGSAYDTGPITWTFRDMNCCYVFYEYPLSFWPYVSTLESIFNKTALNIYLFFIFEKVTRKKEPKTVLNVMFCFSTKHANNYSNYSPRLGRHFNLQELSLPPSLPPFLISCILHKERDKWKTYWLNFVWYLDALWYIFKFCKTFILLSLHTTFFS